MVTFAKRIKPNPAAIAEKLVKEHTEVKLSTEEMVRLTTWVDCNGQYYGSYYGRKNM